MLHASQTNARTTAFGKAVMPAAFALGAAGFVMLAVVVSGQAYTELDIKIAGWVQGLDIAGLDFVASLVNFVTCAPMAVGLWLAAMTFLVLKGRPLEAIAVFLIIGLWTATQIIGVVVDRPTVPAELAVAVDFSRTESGSFPSGHATGAVTFYGLLAFLTLSNVRRGPSRVAIPLIAITMIGLVSLSRIYAGAHWPTDILGSYLLGFMGVASIAWLYTNVKYDTLHIPRPGGKSKNDAEPAIEGVTIAGSIASKVYLDWKAGTATKEYNPPMPVRALYWVAFQAPFPYQVRKDSLEAAAAKRKIAGLLTKHRFGYDMAAAAYGIQESDHGYRFVTELIEGSEPASNVEVEDLLNEMYAYFQETGMPTWQIAPGNPHAYSNFIRRPNGEMKLIDLESALVSTSYPWRELRAALRDGNFPTFDDVDFVQLRTYVDTHARELTNTLGASGLTELSEAVDSAESSSESWKDSELRIWGRVSVWVYRVLDMSGPFRAIGRRMESAEAMSINFLTTAVGRWEQEGKIDGDQAATLRNSLGASEMSAVVKHLGAHMILSIVIAIPIPGLRSLARAGWTLSFRLKGLYGRATGKITKEEYRAIKSIHTVKVMLLALVPVVGAASYAVSDPMLKGPGRLLMDESASRLPFKLYTRLHLARFTAPRTTMAAGATVTLPAPAISVTPEAEHETAEAYRIAA